MKLILTILTLSLLSYIQPANAAILLNGDPIYLDKTTALKSANTASDTLPVVTDQEILDFIHFLISSGELQTEKYLSSNPEPFFPCSEDEILQELLIKTTAKDTLPLKQRIFTITSSHKVLTEKDIEFIEVQHQRFENFQWDTKSLGFNQETTDYWNKLSLPYFSVDKQKVLIQMRGLCSGLCGGGEILLFEKKDNQWKKATLTIWYH